MCPDPGNIVIRLSYKEHRKPGPDDLQLTICKFCQGMRYFPSHFKYVFVLHVGLLFYKTQTIFYHLVVAYFFGPPCIAYTHGRGCMQTAIVKNKQ